MRLLNKRACGSLQLAWMLSLFAAVTHADDYAAEWGPQVGTPMPELAAPDHTGAARTLDNLAGDNGLLLVLTRSADW
ncbi:MAG: hypothetical protein AAF529_11445 [Pseudomonadota bacterium]